MNYKKFTSFMAVFFLALFCAFMFFYERYTHNNAQTTIEKHALVIADSLWNFNSQGSLQYLSLACKSNCYKEIVVTDTNGVVFQKVAGENERAIDKLFISLKLLPTEQIKSAVIYNGMMIGQVEAIRRCDAIYLESYVLLALIMLYMILYLNARLFYEKHLLEIRVCKRTEDLANANSALQLEISKKQQIMEEKQESEKRFEDLANLLPLPVWETDMAGNFIYANHAACNSFCYTQHDIEKGLTIAAFIAPEDRMRIVEDFDKILRGIEVGNYEYLCITKKGRKFSSLIYSSPIIKIGKPSGFRGIILDITDRKAAEEAVRKSEKQLRELTDKLPQSLCEVNKDGIITYANQSAFKTFGYSETDLMTGLHIFDMIASQDRDRIATITKDLFQGRIEKTTGNEYAALRKDGSMFPVLIYTYPILEEGSPAGIRSLVVDISDRKEAEETLQRLMSAIEQAGESFVITDSQATIQYVNPAFEQITGYTREEAIGQNPRILKSGEHNHVFYEKMWAQLLRGEEWRGHFVNKKKDGTLFEENATISPVRNAEGKITNYVAVKRDVTRKVFLEKQLQQSRKMESIGTLAGGIAHDFNNILTAILGYAEIAKYDIPRDSIAIKRIDNIIKAGERAADLIQQILTFSRRETQHLQSLMPAPIVKEALKLLRSSLPTTAIIKEEIDFDCGFIQADPTQVHQIVLNLCTNAFQSLENQKGTICVGLHRTDIALEEIIGEPGVSPGPFIVLSVSDTGSGINQALIERIFEPYFTTKNAGEGTGLGLAVVHGIVKSYHGFIKTESVPGEGTTFHVHIPATDKDTFTLQKPEKNEALPGGTERILLVDDEEPILEVNGTTLRQLGYEVTATANSQEALEKIRAQADRFDLIITDQTMPNLSGAELAREALTIRPDLPIILCTGYSAVLSEEKAFSLGVKKYLRKPVKQRELAKTVRHVLDARR